MTRSDNPIVLAFSGGLDTSFCIPWLKETYKRPVVTVTVNCGGIDAPAAKQLDERARALGAADHKLIEARPEFFDKVIKFLIMGNVRRGNLYPLAEGDRYFSILPTNHAIDFMCGFVLAFLMGGAVVHQRTLRPALGPTRTVTSSKPSRRPSSTST